MAKLSDKQREAWNWTHTAGRRRWHGDRDGLTDPSASALGALVRKGYLRKSGSAGWPIHYERTAAGRLALTASEEKGS